MYRLLFLLVIFAVAACESEGPDITRPDSRHFENLPELASLSDISGLVYQTSEILALHNDTDGLEVSVVDTLSKAHVFILAQHDGLRSSEGDDRYLVSWGDLCLKASSESGNFQLSVDSTLLLDSVEIESLNHSSQTIHLHEFFVTNEQVGYLIDGIYQGTFHNTSDIDLGKLVLGNSPDMMASTEGEISVVSVFDRHLSDRESQQVRSYILSNNVRMPAKKQGMVLRRTKDEEGFKSPVIVELDNNTFALVYSVRRNGVYEGITYATATKSDPHNWTKSGRMILSRSESGWDSHNISDVWIIRDGNIWKMLYADRSTGAIGLASGPTLNELKKYEGNPVLTGTTGMQTYVRYPSFIKIGNIYHLFYDGRADNPAGHHGAVYHAKSRDLIHWERSPDPVVGPSEAGGGFTLTDAAQPAVVEHNGRYYLAWAGFNNDLKAYCCPHQIGIAVYESLVGWRDDTRNPILSWSYGDWDTVNASEPFLWSLDGELLLYYMGKREPVGAGGDFGVAKIDLPTGVKESNVYTTKTPLTTLGSTP